MARAQPISFLNSDKFPEKGYDIYRKSEQFNHHPLHTFDEHFPKENP